MNRRKFLQAGATGALTGPDVLADIRDKFLPSHSTLSERLSAPVVYTQDEERRRLLHIAICEKSIHSCMRKQLVTNYLPGQCTYNLGEYPCRTPWQIEDYDVQLLDKLKTNGIQLIQLHEEWNDSQRLYGATKFTPLNPSGFRRFIDLAHQRDMKVIVYASSGFFERRDPDFRAEWARDQDLVELFYNYARCSPASPGWRAYVLNHIFRLMDEYGIDGIYNDLGYIPLGGNPNKPAPDEVMAFSERADEDGVLGDLLAQIYAGVHRRGGIVKVHCGATDRPHSKLLVYDYLWVGEEIESGDSLREAVKDYPPYVVPCLDMSKARIENEEELYLHSIPYLQFPLLVNGKPFTGERGLIPGIKYVPESEDFWTAHCRKIWNYYKEHPDGPFSYGWWDSVPGRPGAQQTHAKWLALYAPMVGEGTWTWLQVDSSSLFRSSVPRQVVVSVFANQELYLVLANYSRSPIILETAASYFSCIDTSAPAKSHVRLNARSLSILRMDTSTLPATNPNSQV